MTETHDRGTFEGQDGDGLLARFIEKVDFNGPAHPYRDDLPPCWVWTGARVPKGYKCIKVWGRTVGAHRLAWQWENGRPPGDAMVLHSCGNPACVNPAHLRLGSNTDNMLDKKERERQARGVDHGKAVLTAEQVVHIITSPASGASLGRLYGVGRNTVWGIRRRRNWKHLHRLLDDLMEALWENAAARRESARLLGQKELPAAGEEPATGGGEENFNTSMRHRNDA